MTEDFNAINLQRIADALERLAEAAEAADAIAALMAAGPALAATGAEPRSKPDAAEGWTPHNGGERPVNAEVPTDVRFRDGDECPGLNAGWWDHAGWWTWQGQKAHATDILAYRLHKEPAK